MSKPNAESRWKDLVKGGLISLDQLRAAQADAVEHGDSLGEAMVRTGLLTREQLDEALKKHAEDKAREMTLNPWPADKQE